MRQANKTYVGIDQDINGGMTDIGKIIRDAWVFELIPESETCAGWSTGAIEDLWRKVNDRWTEIGFRVGNLPEDARQRFDRIQAEALARARAAGWDPDKDLTAD